jgi:MFS family permease
MGIFYGFGNNAFYAVYSLILLEIFTGLGAAEPSSAVGLYYSAMAIVAMAFTFLTGEIFRRFTKANVFYVSLMVTAICSFMMAFPIAPGTFIALDIFSNMFWILIGMAIPLFLADFATKKMPLTKLNGRYHLWLNIGCLFSPMAAMWIAGMFGYRSALMLVAAVMLFGLLYYTNYKVQAMDKPQPKLNTKRTMKSVWRATKSYFSNAGLVRAYMANLGYRSLQWLRKIYIPIVVVGAGFSDGVLGWVLTLGIIPFIIFSELVAKWARRTGNRFWMIVGFVAFGAMSVAAVWADGYLLLILLIGMMFAQALQEPVHDLLFFDAVKKSDQSRLMGIYNTNQYVGQLLAPMMGAGAIMIFGTPNSVWGVTAIISLLCILMLISPKHHLQKAN